MNKKYLLLPLVCLVMLSSCQLFGNKKQQIQKEIVPLSAFDESLQLEADHVKNLRLHGATKPGEKSIYTVEKESIINSYNHGDRSLTVLRTYIYLAALEWNFDLKKNLEKELCTAFPTTCKSSIVNVSLSGKVQGSNGKPIVGVLVEVLWTTYSTKTDAKGKYALEFPAQSPAVLRLRASSDTTMVGIKKIELADGVRLSSPSQTFERNFTLVKPFNTAVIDTAKKTINGSGTSMDSTGFVITTPYTKYNIPFDTIVKGDVPYVGKLKAMVFEFDRSSGDVLLDADAFDGIEGFATSLFVTYGMPYIIFTAEDGTRLDVKNTRPMFIATTKRESDERTKRPEFQELYDVAFADSQKKPGKYPINNKWLFDHGNLQIIPSWWVMDRSTGYWDNVGMRFVSNNPDAPYNVEAPFYTVFVGQR